MRITAISLILVFHVSTAFAEEPKLEVDANGHHAWSRGVSEEERKVARALLKEGNSLFNQGLLLPAQAKYEEALKHWKQPGIQYMLGVSLRNTGQLLEAYEQIVDSLKYGGYGEEQEDISKYNKAKSFKIGLEKQLVRVRIKSDEPGARVEMDGRMLFIGPGSYEGMILPGTHAIIASKKDYVDHRISRGFEGGEKPEIDLPLITTEAATEYKRRWPNSKAPWWTLGAGAVVAGTGALLLYEGDNQVKQSKNRFDDRCGTSGCAQRQADLWKKRARGRTLQKIGWGVSIAGGVGLVTGGMLIYLNRQRPFQIHDPYKDSHAKTALEVTPVFLGDGYGISANLTF